MNPGTNWVSSLFVTFLVAVPFSIIWGTFAILVSFPDSPSRMHYVVMPLVGGMSAIFFVLVFTVCRCGQHHRVDALKTVGYGLVIILMVAGAWFIVNYRATMRMPPDKAAIEVVKRFETSPVGDYSARLVDTVGDSDRPMSVFVVSHDGQDCARVALSPFLRLGWQPQEYQRVGVEGTSENLTIKDSPRFKKP